MTNLFQNGDFSLPLAPAWTANLVVRDLTIGDPSPSARFELQQGLLKPTLQQSAFLGGLIGLFQLTFSVFVQTTGAGLTVLRDNDINIFTATPIPGSFVTFSFVFSAGDTFPDVTIIFVNDQVNGNVWLDNVSLVRVGGGICYAGKSKILARNTLTKKISTTNAEDIVSGTHEVFNMTTKSFVPVKLNIVTNDVNHYMLIKKDILSKNHPSEDFYVTPGHMLMINGKEVKARDIPQAIKV